MKKQSFILILSIFCLMSLNAATVSVLVVETGLSSGNGCTPSAMVWESGFMDTLFEAGHIVSNAPCMQIINAFDSNADRFASSGVLPREVNGDFDQARIGGADFFVLVILDYKEGALELPKEVFVRVFHVSTGELLHETRVAARLWANSDEELRDVKQQAVKVIPQLVKKG
ncbi:MAG: hypothetical protein FWG07_08225 [Treponema sp.]|nr:hypothetical protein [Treponema sp.]